jgi:SAM-dependent methyltransferase
MAKKTALKGKLLHPERTRKPLTGSERKLVFDAIVKGKGKGSRVINGLLNPAERRAYPSFMLGSRSKVPRESYYGWRLVPQIREALANALPGRHIPGSLIKEALYKRSAMEYEREWTTSPKERWKKAPRVKTDSRRGQTTRQRIAQWAADIQKNIKSANSKNAELISPELRRKLDAAKKTGKVTVVDLGSGAGGTILPIIGRLNSAQRKKVSIALVDVSAKDMQTAKEALVSMGVQAKNIKTLKVNFGELGKSRAIRNLAGKADLVTAGASLHHLSRSETIFREVNHLLKADGSFKFWDWCHPAWRAGTIQVAPKGARVSINGRAYSYRGKVVKAERGLAFISQEIPKGRGSYKAPSELAQAREMLSTWVSLLNFPQAERRNFERWFDRQVEAGKPISFEAYLQRLEKKLPSKPAQIEVMEGHKLYRLYERALRGSLLAPNATRFYTGSNLLAHYEARKREPNRPRKKK